MAPVDTTGGVVALGLLYGAYVATKEPREAIATGESR